MSDNTELKNKIESAWENITKISPNDTDIADAVNEVIKKLDTAGHLISKDNAGNQIGLLAIGFLIAGLTSRIAGILIDFLNNRIENLGYFSLLAIAGSCFILGPMATFLIKGNIDESISNKS